MLMIKKNIRATSSVMSGKFETAMPLFLVWKLWGIPKTSFLSYAFFSPLLSSYEIQNQNSWWNSDGGLRTWPLLLPGEEDGFWIKREEERMKCGNGGAGKEWKFRTIQSGKEKWGALFMKYTKTMNWKIEIETDQKSQELKTPHHPPPHFPFFLLSPSLILSH